MILSDLLIVFMGVLYCLTVVALGVWGLFLYGWFVS